METFFPEWHSGRNWNVKLLTGIWKMFIQSWSQSTTSWAMEEYVLWNCISDFKCLAIIDNETWIARLPRKGFPKSILPKIPFLSLTPSLTFWPWTLSVSFYLLSPRTPLPSYSFTLQTTAPALTLSISQPIRMFGLAHLNKAWLPLLCMCWDGPRGWGFPEGWYHISASLQHLPNV